MTINQTPTNIYGWSSESEVAMEIYNTKGSLIELLEGPLVFAYKNISKTGTVKLLVITKRLDSPGFRLGLLPFTGGWTEFIPDYPGEYVLKIAERELQENKTEDRIIEDLKEYIRRYE